MDPVCPTCGHPMPSVPAPDRPDPLSDPRMELTARVVASAGQVTARTFAGRLAHTHLPNAALVERARRQLDAAVRAGVLVTGQQSHDENGARLARPATVYRPASAQVPVHS